MNSAAQTPEGIIYLGPPVMSIIQPTTNVSAPAPPRSEYWGTEWTGQLYIPTTGTYQFLMGSDDGGWFYLDGTLLLSEPGNHGTFNITTSRTLTAGFHSLRGEMFNWAGPYNFYLQWAPPGQGFQTIPTANLFQQPLATSTVTLGTPAPLPNGSVALTYNWNTGVTAAAPYTAVATLRQYGAFITSNSAPFTITPATQIAAAIATDKTAYDAGNTVHAAGSVTQTSGNTTATNLSATITILDAGGTAVAASASSAIASLIPGQSVPVKFDWAAGSAAPGTYSAKISVRDAGGAVRAEASAPFVIRSSGSNGKGITGTLSLPDTINQGQSLPIAASITNGGNAALTDAPFAVQILDPSTQTLVTTLPFTASIAVGGTTATPLSYPVGIMNPQQYTATLVSLITGSPVPLATAPFTVKFVPTIVNGTIATDKAEYDVNDIVHAKTNVELASAPLPLTALTVNATITNPGGTVVVTNTQSIATINPGQIVPVAFDWNAGTNPPGTYTINAVVTDAANKTWAQPTATFVIRSTAVTGIGVSGTLTAAAAVIQRQPLPLTATVKNDGNVDLTNAPFAVIVESDTLPFTATLAMGASATQPFTEPTAALAPGDYTARLVSLITGSPVTLATAPFTVKPIPTIVTDTVAVDKAAYDPGNTLHETTTVSCSSAPATLTNLTVVVTITDPSGNVVATGTSPIASLEVGGNAATTFDWPVTTAVPPGNYTLIGVVKSAAGAQLATSSTAFAIRPTSVTGIGVTGTLTTLASVTQGDPLPLTATITNAGNIALADAPFAIKISSDTLPFTLSVPLGGSNTKQLTYNTLPLFPGNYTATLVSLITGSPATLATAQFTVKPAVTLTVTPSTTARVLIWSDCSNGNSVKPCTATAPPFLTKTLTDAGIAWTLVGDEDAFLAKLRTGAYTVAILDPPPTSEPNIAAEVSESIHAGAGVLVIHDHPDAMPKLAAALGVSYNGNLNATSTLLDILLTPISKSGQITVNGDGAKITLDTAKAAALLSATQMPAISYNVFGGGRVVVLPFDAEKTPTSDMAAFLLGVVAYVNRTPATDARAVVPLDFAVTAPVGGSQSVTVNVALPQGVTVVSASPQLTTAAPPSWSVTVPSGTTTHLTLWVRLPEDTGTYTVTGTLVLAGQSIGTKTLTLKVTADRAAMESALAAALTALRANAPASDQQKLDDAQAQFSAIQGSTDAVANVKRILTIVDDLQKVSIDTTAARTDADRMLIYWQSRIGS